MLRQAVIASLLVATAAAAQPAKAPAGNAPGSLAEAVPLPGAPAGARAFRVRYRTLDADRRPITASGAVIVPAGRAPAAGRDVIVWNHGTTGVTPQCGPSVNNWLWDNVAGLEAMLGRGYVVVVPDYPGLGSPGQHGFLIGTGTAHAVLDSVRAAAGVPRARASGRAGGSRCGANRKAGMQRSGRAIWHRAMPPNCASSASPPPPRPPISRLT